MQAECLRDTYGTPQTGLFIRGAQYDIDPKDPWAIHFKLPPNERKIAVAEHRRRVKEATERRSQKISMQTGDEFEDEDQAEEKFPCDRCGKEFKNAAGLGSHVFQMHKDS